MVAFCNPHLIHNIQLFYYLPICHIFLQRLYKIVFHQIIKKEKLIIVDSKIAIVAIDQLGSLVKIPEILQKKIGNI